MTDKTHAIRAYARAMAAVSRAERDEEQARQGVDEALGALDARLRDAMQGVLHEFEGEYGFQPAEIEITMLEKTMLESLWSEYVLGRVEAKY